MRSKILRVSAVLNLMACLAACKQSSAPAAGTDAAAAGTDAAATGDASGSAGPLVPGTTGLKVADYMIGKWPALDATAADCTGPDTCFSMNFATAPAGPAPKFWEYTYGVPVYALQKLYDKTGNTKYLDYVKRYVDRYVDATGTISYAKSWPVTTPATPPSDPTIQDVIQPSILLSGLYRTTNDDRYLKAMTSTRKNFDLIKTNSAGAFWHKPSYPNQQWLDAIYMGEPFLVKYGALHAEAVQAGDSKTCFDMATNQIKLAAAHTFDVDKGLYHHAWNGAADGKWLGLAPPSKTPPLDGVTVSPVLWSRSLAWFITGVVDVLDDLPKDHPDRDALINIVKTIATGLKKYQDPGTGLWYQVIDVMGGPLPANGGYPSETVPAASNWLETSASGLFSYSLAKATRLGYLTADFRDVAKKAWDGVKTKVDVGADGTVVIHGTVVGMSVGGTYNAYVNADFRSDLTAALPPPAPAATCPTTGTVGISAPTGCKYIYVRDNVPQGFAAVLLAAIEMEF